MILKVYSEGKITLEKQLVESITLPTESGVITILEDHTALLSKLAPGEILIESKDETNEFFIEGGILKIKDNKIELIVDTLQSEKDIIFEETQKAKLAAEKILESPEAINEAEISRLEAIIQKESARQDFYTLRRRGNTVSPENE